ncbi:MAG: VWA domain-containing protein [Phycisphaeraceae bacterium]|nr:VWA domain-containing protein [Phycisphaeraceae bacterium]
MSLSLLALSWLDWLFGLDQLSWSDAGAQLDWRFELPILAWVLIVAASAAVGWLSYRRLEAHRRGRIIGAGLRAMIVLLAAVLLAGPQLLLPRERVEPDSVIVLVDRSASMQIRDMTPAEAGLGDHHPMLAADRSVSRDQIARLLLESGEQLVRRSDPSADQPTRRVKWLGFDQDVREVDPDRLPPAAGPATRLRAAIEHALRIGPDRRVAGIVLVTDGRSSEAIGPALLRRLKQEAIGLYPLPLGAATPPLDVAVGRVEGPRRAFVEDAVPVRAWVRQTGEDEVSGQVSVRLVDVASEEVLDEKTLPADHDPTAPLVLTGRSALAGPTQWEVEVVYEGSKPELLTDNNRQRFSLDLIDRPIRVLMVEGYPRWEYRFLKNVLVRDKKIESSVQLVTADPTFVQEGDVPLARLPITGEEIRPFDVVIIGDVAASFFSPGQLELFRDHVAVRGAGLIWMGGARENPVSYANTPLSGLLPMKDPASVRRLDPTIGAVEVLPTEAARDLNVLRLTNEGDRGWPANLPGLLWTQAIGPLKPAATPLAVADTGSSDPMPVVVRMPYGSGQSVYIATDEIWRWRFGTGDRYYDPFWTQLIQLLGRDRVRQGDQPVQLTLSHRQGRVSEPVVLRLVIEDPALVETVAGRVNLQIKRDDQTVARVPLLADDRSSSSLQGRQVYTATWTPPSTGRYSLEVDEPALAGFGLAAQLEVVATDAEMRQAAADHVQLASLARDSGGRVVPVSQVSELPMLLPNRARRVADDLRESIWDSPLALALVLLLLTGEWVIRKVIRLA